MSTEADNMDIPVPQDPHDEAEILPAPILSIAAQDSYAEIAGLPPLSEEETKQVMLHVFRCPG